jgi:hypothetical protein
MIRLGIVARIGYGLQLQCQITATLRLRAHTPIRGCQIPGHVLARSSVHFAAASRPRMESRELVQTNARRLERRRSSGRAVRVLLPRGARIADDATHQVRGVTRAEGARPISRCQCPCRASSDPRHSAPAMAATCSTGGNCTTRQRIRIMNPVDDNKWELRAARSGTITAAIGHVAHQDTRLPITPRGMTRTPL